MEKLGILLLWLLLTLATVLSSSLEERLNFTISEGEPAGTLVGKIPLRQGYTYTLNERSPLFTFNPTTGDIRTSAVLDREGLESDRIDLVVLGSQPTYFTVVRITVTDINDNSPYFPLAFQNVSIPESAKVGTQLVIPSAQDRDAGLNGAVNDYQIVSGNEEGKFKLTKTTKSSGEAAVLLELISPLDREQRSLYALNISAKDEGTPPNFGFTLLYVNVLDANDNPPVFNQSHYRTKVSENIPVGTELLIVTATDADINENAQISYSIGNDPFGQFGVDPKKGRIFIKSKLQCPEKSCTPSENGSKSNCSRVCIFTVEAVDHGIPSLRGRAFVDVELKDENDHDPVILFRYYPPGADFATVDEAKPNGSVVAVVTVMDADSGDNGRTHVEIANGNERGDFRLETNDLFSLVRLNRQLQREKVAKYNLTVLASDWGTPPRTSTKSLLIYVNDANDKPPVFSTQRYAANISSSTPIGSYVTAISAKQRNSHSSTGVQYGISGGNELGFLKINRRTGLITTAKSLENCPQDVIVLKVTAKDGGPTVEMSSAQVDVRVIRVKSFLPRFTTANFNFSVLENLTVGSQIADLKILANDSNGRTVYSIQSGHGVLPFKLNSVTGTITVSTQLDYEKQNGYTFTVIAADAEWPSHMDSCTVRVSVEDVNDNRPIFYPTDHYANLVKSSISGSFIARVRATDADSGKDGTVTYTILQGPPGSFAIDPTSGVLSLNRYPFERETVEVVIGAMDGGGLNAANNATVHIYIVESADQLPKFSHVAYDFSVVEDTSTGSTVGKAVGSVSATDSDRLTGRNSNAKITYHIADGDETGMFEVGRFSGEIRATRALDREEKENYQLKVVAFGTRGVTSVDVRVILQDINDCRPTFSTAPEDASVDIELNLSAGYPVFYASAVDLDSGSNGIVRYTIDKFSGGDEFHVDSLSGTVYLAVPAFSLKFRRYALQVTATDMGSPSLSSSLKVNVTVLPNSSPPPLFSRSSIDLVVSENTPVNQRLMKVNLTDGPVDVIFRTVREWDLDAFGIFPDGGIYVRNQLDFETENFHRMEVEAVDKAGQSAKMQVNLNILDENDNSPVCDSANFRFNLSENQPMLSHVGMVEVTDADSGLNGRVTLKLVSERDDFLLDRVSGNLQSLAVFDREDLFRRTGSNVVSMKVLATDHGVNPQTAMCSLEVRIVDVNDNRPAFTLEFYSAIVPENKEIGQEILRVSATDEDEGVNGAIQYEIVSGNEEKIFSLHLRNGQLTLAKSLDREKTADFHLEIVARDGGNPSLNNSAFVSIIVADVNDNSPDFVHYVTTVNVSEWAAVGDEIALFEASDPDDGQNGEIRYGIPTGNGAHNFEINPITGRLVLIKPLDFEAVPLYTLTISASDQGVPSRSTSTPLIVRVVDENDIPPVITSNSLIAQVSEDSPIRTQVLQVTATDADSGANGRVHFTLVDQQPMSHFEIDLNTGFLVTKGKLDREAVDTYKLTVRAEDQAENVSNRLWTERKITIVVTDVNDNRPEFAAPDATIVPVGAAVGYKITQLQSRDLDAGVNGSVGYRLMQINSTTATDVDTFGLGLDGSLYLKSNLNPADLIFRLKIQLFDQMGLAVTGDRLMSDYDFTVIPVGLSSGGLSFWRDMYTFDVSEESPLDTVVGNVSVKGGLTYGLEYHITRLTVNGTDYGPIPLQIDRSTGVLKVAQKLDFHRRGSVVIADVYAVVTVGTEAKLASCKVRLNILDASDTPPRFTEDLLEAEVSEDVPIGTKVVTVSAIDHDTVGVVVYTFTNLSSAFTINSQSGVITTKSQLDRETVDTHHLVVNANDGLYSTLLPVRIRILDVNDFTPNFTQSRYDFVVAEGLPRGIFIGRVTAEDKDVGANGQVSYHLGSPSDIFVLESESGVITLNGFVDYEQIPLYKLQIDAIDKGKPPLKSSVDVWIHVSDLNDNPPVIQPATVRTSVAENTTVGSVLSILNATDADSDTQLIFEISSGDPWGYFSVESNGSLVLRRQLDRETRPVHHLSVLVSDRPKVSLGQRFTTAVDVIVTVTDINDNSPNFLSPNVTAVYENSPVGSAVTLLKAVDPDEGLGGFVEYYIDPLTTGHFSMDAVTGGLYVSGQLDREEAETRAITVWAYDRGSPYSLKSSSDITVVILDVNDNRPKFLEFAKQLEVAENMPVGTSLLRMSAIDSDVGDNAALHFAITSGDPYGDFDINPESGVLSVAKPLDINRLSSYILTLQVNNIVEGVWANQSDRVLEPGDYATVHINVTDVNNHNPTFAGSPYFITVIENQPELPAVVGRIPAVDFDRGLNAKLSYSIVQGNTTVFSINAATGDLSTQVPLDREQQDRYVLTVTATDSGSPRLTGSGTVVIRVDDINDNPPVFTQPYYAGTVAENQRSGLPVVSVLATDNDINQNGLVRYEIQEKNSPFRIDELSGLITTREPLDREMRKRHTITVVAKDSGPGRPLSSSVRVVVSVTDENDNCPVFNVPQSHIYIPNSIRPGDIVFPVDAFDVDDGLNALISYNISGGPAKNSFEIDSRTGVIRSNIAMSLATGILSIEVTATDSGIPQLSSTTKLSFAAKSASDFPAFGGVSSSNKSLEKLRVSETESGSELKMIVGHSNKLAPLNRLSYSIVAGNVNGGFKVDPDSGKLVTTAQLDREICQDYTLWISAADNDSPPLSSFVSLQVTLDDANDNQPEFTSPVYFAKVLEEEIPPVALLTVTAVDKDSGLNGAVEYSLMSEGNIKSAFTVDPHSGLVSTQVALDREKISHYRLTVMASDKGSPPLNQTAVIDVTVLDVNDNAPKFTQLFNAEVFEDATVGTFVVQVTSSDADSIENANNTYFLSNNPGQKFTIDPYSGNVSVNGSLDRETTAEYSLKVVAIDGSWRVETSLTISILDVNDLPPVFQQHNYTFRVSEEQQMFTPIGKLNATDGDGPGPNSQVSYRLKTKSDIVHVDPVSGVLQLTKSLHCSDPSHTFIVMAKDYGQPSLSGFATVRLHVVAKNEFSPVFAQLEYLRAVERSAAIGSTVIRVTAIDRDLPGPNSDVVYGLGETNGSSPFSIDPATGWLSVVSAIPNVNEYEFNMVVVATDMGMPARSGFSRLKIIITGANQFAPQFTSNFYRATTAEDSRVGHRLLTTTATDKDVGANGIVRFSIAAGNDGGEFSIDTTTGLITVNGTLDYETTNFYNLTVIASDLAVQPKFDIAYVSVTITDVNDNPPLFFSRSMTTSVAENMPPGTIVYQLKATDRDTEVNAKIKFEFASGNELGFFSVHPDSGLIKTTISLDYEAYASHQLHVYASNPGTNLSSEAVLTINVLSVNEFPPKFEEKSFNFTTSQTATAGRKVGVVVATDEDSGPDGQLFYYLRAESKELGFTIDSKSGVISVDRSLSRVTNGTALLSVVVKNRWTTSDEHNPLLDCFDEVPVRIRVELTPPLPTFAREKYAGRVSENSPVGTSVLGISAYSPTGAEIQFSLTSGNEERNFAIDASSGLLHVNGPVDREKKDVYNLTVSAFEKSTPTVFSTTTIMLDISDLNDNPPRLSKEQSVAYVTENEPSGLAIMTLQPTDADLPPNQGPFQFHLVNAEDQRLFEVDSTTGVLRTKVVFDRETKEEYRLQVQLSDSGNPRQTATAELIIRVRDVNDMPSKQRNAIVKVISVDANLGVGRIARLLPTDPDEVGVYECRSSAPMGITFSSGCWMATSSNSYNFPSPLELTVSGWDGVHNRVDSNFSVHFVQLSNSSLQNSLDLHVTIDRRTIVDELLTVVQSLAKQRGIEVELISVETVGRLDDIYSPLRRPHVITLAMRRIGGEQITTDRTKQTIKELLTVSHTLNVTGIVDNLCEPNRCKNNGTCRMDVFTDLTGNFSVIESESIIYAMRPVRRNWHCQCPYAFAGETCELPVDHCANNPCRNSGTCLFDSDGMVKCLCPKGFTGPTCLEDINECDNRSLCQNGGYCENTRGSFRCICLIGFVGDNCQVAVNYCADSPCKNGGDCVGRSDGYNCRCPFSFHGKNCERGSMGFDELSYVELPGFDSQENQIQLEFATTRRDALLLYSYSLSGDSKDYLAVDIVDGRLRLSAVMGSQKQLNLVLQRPVSNGNWYQLHISHSRQVMSISVGECIDGEPTCQQCLVGDSTCRQSANVGLQRVTVSGFPLYVGGVKSFADLLIRPGHLAEFNFVGCIRNFDLNGKGVDSWNRDKMNKVLSSCPRTRAGVCGSEHSCGQGETCVDRWNRHSCICPGGFKAADCQSAKESFTFSEGSFVEYTLKETEKRRLLFTAVAPEMLANIRPKRNGDIEYPEQWLNLQIRTLKPDGLLFFAASGQDFTIIDLANGTMRYSSKTKFGEITVAITEVNKIWDGEWHMISLALQQSGKQVVFRVDEIGKDTRSTFAAHQFVGPHMTDMSVGGSRNQITVYRQKIKGFDGCMARFILNGEVQPLYAGESDTLVAETSGTVTAGCAGVVSCVDPPCTVQSLPTRANMNGGVIAAIVFLICLVVSVAGGFFILKKFRNNKLSRSQSGMSGATGITGMEPMTRNKLNNIAVVSDTVRMGMGSSLNTVKDSGFGDHHSVDYRMMNGRRSNESLLDSQLSLSSALERDLNGNSSNGIRPVPTPRTNVHLGSHAYQNVLLDTTFDETSERYDLDNASSIAPSDVEVSHHYRHYRSDSGSRVATNPQLLKLKNSLASSTPTPSHNGSYRHSPSSIITNGTYRQSPSVVKLKSALRESPAASQSHLSIGSASMEPRRSRPGSTHSNRSRRQRTPTAEGNSPKPRGSTKSSRSGSRRSAGNNSTLRSRSFGRRHSGDESTSSSSSGPAARPLPPSRRSVGKAGVARSPHAPPLRDSSTDSDKSDTNTGGSALDLDKVSRPRRLYYPAEPTEILSDPPLPSGRSIPTPNGRRHLGIPDLSVFSGPFAPQSEDDETQSEMGGGEDVGVVPDLSHFVNRGGEFRQLISGNFGGVEDKSDSSATAGRTSGGPFTPKLTFLHGSAKKSDVSLKETSPVATPKRPGHDATVPVEQNLEAYV